MDDFILQAQPDWRYCRVAEGSKRPLGREWQRNPLTLDQVDTANIGLILGPDSGGIVAVDFDGPSAIEYLIGKNYNFQQLPKTPTWSSGREGRFQCAFRVPDALWSSLRTVKIQTAAQEGLEFRWQGAQSVLPPSRHPDTGQPYEWWTDAMETVKPMPPELLKIWQDHVVGVHRSEARHCVMDEVNVQNLKESDILELNLLLGSIRRRYGSLNYDQWIRVSWAVAHRVGRPVAAELLKDHFPEQRQGEYADLFRDWRTERTPKMGTLYHMAGWTRDTTAEVRHQIWQLEQQRQREEIKKLEQRIEQLRGQAK